MQTHQSFSPGLLYSVAPENFATLHLRDGEKADELFWEAEKNQREGGSFAQAVINFLKKTVARR